MAVHQIIREATAAFSRVDDEGLENLVKIIKVALGVAADERNLIDARELDTALQLTAGEQRRRATEKTQTTKELNGLLVRAGIVEPTPVAEPVAPEALAASISNLAKGLPSIADIARSKVRAQRFVASPNRGTSGPRFIASYGGRDLRGLGDVAGEFRERLRLRATGRITVASNRTSFPDERRLDSDFQANADRIEAALSPQALTASGGICAPPAGFYEQSVYSAGDRPLRDSLPVFGADRGGIRYIPPPLFSDASGSAGYITEAQDTAGVTKDCLSVECATPEEVLVNAVYRCLQLGNFDARFHSERMEAFVILAIAQQARLAESNLWDSMVTASTAVTAAENLSAWRDLYAALARAASMLRSRHRMRPDALLRFVAPFWLADMLSVDLVRQAPGDNTITGVTREQFGTWLRALNIAVSWSLEGGATAPTQVFGAQGVGPLDGWPDTVECLLYPEGTFLFLDGGTLDLGVVRDATLNQTNQLQLFAETFENVAFLGPESLALTIDLCPQGIAAGFDDSPIVCTGVSS